MISDGKVCTACREYHWTTEQSVAFGQAICDRCYWKLIHVKQRLGFQVTTAVTEPDVTVTAPYTLTNQFTGGLVDP